MTLDACASFCAAMTSAFGPTITEYVFIAALAALGWWQARKRIVKAESKVATAQAEVREAKLSIARLEGSLRPAALVPSSSTPPAAVHDSSSSSSALQPVVMPELPVGVAGAMRPSITDPDLLEPTLPKPSAVPSFERQTPPERPSGKRGPT